MTTFGWHNMRAEAFAKVNLGLLVEPVRDDGYHPLLSRFLSISISDVLRLEIAPADRVDAADPDIPGPEENLAWRATETVRALAGVRTGLALHLEKRIPVAAGLGGGSADAAAALMLAARVLGVDPAVAAAAGADLGADVPFCLAGGHAIVSGIGEVVAPQPLPADFALALVVPPLYLATRDVFATWDRLDGPAGSAADPARLPPSLREGLPLRNDLYPAAVHMAPGLDDWRSELEGSWSVPVHLSGSGPALYALWRDADEAAAALAAVPAGARFAAAAEPVPVGWKIDGGTLP
jgi:4-diphosphocytidyl-2-C-methyl-D-erythritol kinase